MFLTGALVLGIQGLLVGATPAARVLLLEPARTMFMGFSL